MKAMQLSHSEQGSTLLLAELPIPVPGSGEILVQVRAAGVTPTELRWYPTLHTSSGGDRINPVPGHEFSGAIAALGQQVSGFSIGEEVYGLNDWFEDGATADYCLATPESLALKPTSFTHEESATVPIGALTAWQGLIERAKLQSGERVLIHGGAGAVGLFAVQLAHRAGAHVISTASAGNLAFVTQLGAAQVIDYRTTRFEEVVGEVDVVFDTVGGETLGRSWSVLRPGGRMITIAGSEEAATDPRVKDAFFIVEPDHSQLTEVARLLDGGQLHTFVKAAVPFARAAEAYAGVLHTEHSYGKVVISI